MTELDHTAVSIRFSGKDLAPKEIGELLGFIESKSTQSTVKKLKRGHVIWSIKLENNVTVPLEKKIEALLAEFTKDINSWKQATANIKAHIFCGLLLDGWNRGFSLTSHLMQEISSRNLKISFDIYSPTESWGK